MQREAHIERHTNETRISVHLLLDATDREVQIETGLPFVDHMLNALAKHGKLALTVAAEGDLEVDAHHTLEDLGLVLGNAIREAVADKSGIQRYGCAFVPMDDALARVALDLSGRPWLGYRVTLDSREVGGFSARLFREFFQALANSGGLTLHVDLLAGEEPHHVFEAIFKAFGRALDQATQLDPRCTGIPSTTGTLE